MDNHIDSQVNNLIEKDIKLDTGKFIKIKCTRCGKNHVTYGKASTRVKCKGCNKLLIKPKGGKAKIRALIEKVL